MLIVETIRKIRLAAHRDKKSIRQIAKEFNLSRNTVRKVLRSDQTAFIYQRNSQPRPKLAPYTEKLDEHLQADHKLPKKFRRTAQILFEELQTRGYQGGYDSVRRYVQTWRRKKRVTASQVYIPLIFDPGEAFQFDWSHEKIELAGAPATVKVAHLRLCHSRFFFKGAYPRETQEMVFDAHRRAFGFFGGSCRRGIYDNMKTAVNKIMAGKERQFNTRFSQMCSHYLFEPVACTPAAGWEKGQVENQVGTVRKRFFIPRVKVNSFNELNDWLQGQCITWAKTHKHPTIKDKTVWQVFEDEKSYLLKSQHPFDGYAERPARVNPSSLVTFDRNRYSVDCSQVGQTVQLRVYADKIVIVSNGSVMGKHERLFGRDHTLFNPWHYLPVLERKPGALRNGAPFKDWDLPEPIGKLGIALQKRFHDWDRQFVSILSAIPLYGIDAVQNACKTALSIKAISTDVVLNLLNRAQDNDTVTSIDLPDHLILKQNPVADCLRYEDLLREGTHVTHG
jgi:transposase